MSPLFLTKTQWKKILIIAILLICVIAGYISFSSLSIPKDKQTTPAYLKLKLQEKPYTHLLFITSWYGGRRSHIDLYQEYLNVLPKDSISFIILASDANFETTELEALKTKGFETTYINKLNAFPLLDKYNVRTFVKNFNISFDKDVDFNSWPTNLLYDRKANVLITEPSKKLFQLNKQSAN